MSEAKEGNTVKVHYTGKLNDGSVFDQSQEDEPLEFKIGEGKLIPAFEQAVEGMEVGDSKTIDIPKDEAYGDPRDDLRLEVERNELPEDIEPEEGMQLQIKNQETDRNIPVRVTSVEEETVTLDANHPLAGEDLTFDIELVDIVKDES